MHEQDTTFASKVLDAITHALWGNCEDGQDAPPFLFLQTAAGIEAADLERIPEDHLPGFLPQFVRRANATEAILARACWMTTVDDAARLAVRPREHPNRKEAVSVDHITSDGRRSNLALIQRGPTRLDEWLGWAPAAVELRNPVAAAIQKALVA